MKNMSTSLSKRFKLYILFFLFPFFFSTFTYPVKLKKIYIFLIVTLLVFSTHMYLNIYTVVPISSFLMKRNYLKTHTNLYHKIYPSISAFAFTHLGPPILRLKFISSEVFDLLSLHRCCNTVLKSKWKIQVKLHYFRML